MVGVEIMKYYKLGNQIFAFETDGSQDDYIADDMVLMTKAEVDEHLKVEVLPLEQTLPPLTRRQFKLALLHAGLTDEINTAIAGIDDATLKAVIEIEYNEATQFVRTSDSVAYMCNLLSLSNDEINAIWSSAAQL